ncbi:MAG: hypothetical protein ACJ8EF_11155 [Bradyrhizobium sp.]|jgi:hypothetical protein
MKVLVISAFASVALLVFAATMLRSHSRTAEFPFASANPVPVKEPNGKSSGNKLPIEDFEDMSLVYSRR